MTTLLQIEAFVAVVDMGSFDGAARFLNVAQSAVSRQIHEFEARFRRPLFDRSGRAARLTADGAEVLVVARAVLRQRDVLMNKLATDLTLQRSFSVGLTELAALTWLPRFVEAVKSTFPKVELRLEVGMAPTLHAALEQGRVDLVVVPDVFQTPEMRRLPMASFTSGWYCSPSYNSSLQRLSVARLSDHTLLTQGSSSEVGNVISAWLTKQGVRPRSNLFCNSLSALGGMAIAGLGMANMPSAVATELVAVGMLREVKVLPSVPRMHYVALVRRNAVTPLHEKIIALARSHCDYETPYQAVRPSAAAPNPKV